MPASILSLIDHAVLQPAQTAADVRAGCELCLRMKPASICVKPADVALAADLLSGSGIAVSTVIAFPHGSTSTAAKRAEAEIACRAGARELDMVVHLGRVLAGDWQSVEDDIAGVVAVARQHAALVKVILETGLLPDDETKTHLARVCVSAGAAFVKTSTGFGMRRTADGHFEATGAIEHDVRLLRAACPPHVGIKASGGIRSLPDAERMVAAGASRLGTSATEAIARELAGQGVHFSPSGY